MLMVETTVGARCCNDGDVDVIGIFSKCRKQEGGGVEARCSDHDIVDHA